MPLAMTPLIIDGRIVREWNESEIAAYRVQGDSAMETALASAAREHPPARF